MKIFENAGPKKKKRLFVSLYTCAYIHTHIHIHTHTHTHTLPLVQAKNNEAGGLGKVAWVTGPGFPFPFLPSPALPCQWVAGALRAFQRVWESMKGCAPSVAAIWCWKVPVHTKSWVPGPLELTCWKVCCSSFRLQILICRQCCTVLQQLCMLLVSV